MSHYKNIYLFFAQESSLLPSSSILLRMPASMAPEMLCHTEKIAPGTVARDRSRKAVHASEVASPEFCQDYQSHIFTDEFAYNLHVSSAR